MKQKISVTLAAEVLAAVDRLASSKMSRSAFIEGVLRQYLRQRKGDQAPARDLQRINLAASRLNAEAAHVLKYQSSKDLDHD
jgi:metal-responsive CopG/Arc/MetJ family transcriptional regulator